MNHWEKQEAEKATLKEWLMSLKEGDEVAIPDRSHYRRAPLITVVLKVTTTQLVVKEHAMEVRYNRHDGTRRGTGHNTLKPVTDEVRAAVKLAADREWLRDITYRDDKIAAIPPAVLEAMRAAYSSCMALHQTKQHQSE
ncbi:hypothetical protein [Paraburkholderia hospita]|uniref:hypothetical protein n=1 Tax=Paraburkholderia hospita TaxID=169430 RepID=UPI0008A73EE2|nr:hypothetical protein [Paraburkholderia hospita]SEH89291.1 hypothetical protein SAMN05192544_1011113 [Paraburkholderia hospita]